MIVDMPLLLFLFILVTMALTFFTRLPNKKLLVFLFIPLCFFEAFFFLPWIWQVSGLEHLFSYYTRIEIAFPKITISERTFNLIFFALLLFTLVELSIGLHELTHHKKSE